MTAKKSGSISLKLFGSCGADYYIPSRPPFVDSAADHQSICVLPCLVGGSRTAPHLVGFMATTSTMMIARCVERGIEETPVSLGYDRIRFVKPVFIGDTVTVAYTIATIDNEKRRRTAKIEISNQRGEVVAVGDHILRWVSRGNRIS